MQNKRYSVGIIRILPQSYLNVRYIFTTEYAQILRVSHNLQVGIIGINEGLVSCAEAAFGGMKESGLGREGGSQGIDEFSQWKYICIGF
uniref:Bm4124 n=1 Tax=Brugia malayi TaxID=6279 RepID=A0A0I9N8A1_BRUMA|nr:Bm4124 [Brugia malayi]